MTAFEDPNTTPSEVNDETLGPAMAYLLEEWQQLDTQARERFTFLEFASRHGVGIPPALVEQFNKTMKSAAERIDLGDYFNKLNELDFPPDEPTTF